MPSIVHGLTVFDFANIFSMGIVRSFVVISVISLSAQLTQHDSVQYKECQTVQHPSPLQLECDQKLIKELRRNPAKLWVLIINFMRKLFTSQPLGFVLFFNYGTLLAKCKVKVLAQCVTGIAIHIREKFRILETFLANTSIGINKNYSNRVVASHQ